MKRISYTLLCGLMLPIMAKAQKGNIPAPANSSYIIEYNLPFIFAQTSADRLNMSEMGRQLYETLFFKNRNYESDLDVTASGLDHGQKAYMHMVNTDSATYTLRLLPLKDVARFKKAVGITPDSRTQKTPDGIFYELKFKEQVYIPNTNDHAILISLSGTYSAFQDEERAQRWGIELQNDHSYYDDVAVEAVTVDTAAYMPDLYDEEVTTTDADEVVQEVEDMMADAEAEVQDAEAEAYDIVEMPAVEAPPMAVETRIYAEEMPYTNDHYRISEAKKDSVYAIWARSLVTDMVKGNKDTYQRLSDLKDLEAPKNNAAATFYMNSTALNMGDLYAIFGFGSRLDQLPTGSENEIWSMFQLSFEPNAIRVDMTSRLSDQMAASSKRIYKRKYNKKFSRYINSATDIGLWTMAVNTRNYLEETPVIVKDALNMYGLWPEESSILADLFGLVVDEKAVGKLFWGDGAFIFTNVKDKSYQSVTYNWDQETFESSEEEVSKTEALPNFLFMMTTKDVPMISKMLDYGVKKEAYTFQNGIYAAKKLSGNYDPFEFFCTIKDGIVFIGTERAEIEGIRDGKKRGNMSAADKKLMRRNHTSGWMHTRRLAGTFMKNEQDNLNTIRVNNMLSNIGVLQFKSGKMKGNKMYADVSLHTPNSKTNALEYLLHLIDDLKSF